MKINFLVKTAVLLSQLLTICEDNREYDYLIPHLHTVNDFIDSLNKLLFTDYNEQYQQFVEHIIDN